MNQSNDNQNQKTNPYDVPLADHEYDGIQELNNPAPFWWQLFFYLSIAFGIFYYAYYELGTGSSSDSRLQADLAEVSMLQKKVPNLAPSADEFEKLAKDDATLSAGKMIFSTKCASCHLSDGGGSIGPNLTDRYWLHGRGSFEDIYEVVRTGVLDKGMPPWGSMITPTELKQVVVYVKALQGTKPQTPKAAQGMEYP